MCPLNLWTQGTQVEKLRAGAKATRKDRAEATVYSWELTNNSQDIYIYMSDSTI